MLGSIVEKLAVGVVVGIVAGIGALKLRENLPGDPSPDNIQGLEKLDFVERSMLRLVFAAGIAKTEVRDFFLMKTATVRFPDQEIKLVAFPFTGWLSAAETAEKPVVIEG
jgi:hypothetical protein